MPTTSTTTATKTHYFAVTNISNAGNGRVSINLTEVAADYDPTDVTAANSMTPGGFTSSLTLNTSVEEAKAYNVGTVRKVDISTPAAPAPATS